jgi:hypothetical protein
MKSRQQGTTLPVTIPDDCGPSEGSTAQLSAFWRGFASGALLVLRAPVKGTPLTKQLQQYAGAALRRPNRRSGATV